MYTDFTPTSGEERLYPIDGRSKTPNCSCLLKLSQDRYKLKNLQGLDDKF